MRKRRFFNFLFPVFLMITLSALLASGYFISRAVRRFYFKQLVTQLEARANIINWQTRGMFHPDSAAALDSLAKSLGALSHTRLTFILPEGRVIADSEEDPALMENHRRRPEIEEALAGRTGIANRYSATVKRKMFYLAIPGAGEKGRHFGIVRVSVPVEDISQALNELYAIEIFSLTVIGLLAVVVSYLAAARIARPVKQMQVSAERFAKGDFSRQVEIPRFDELASLAETLNCMAGGLEERISIITDQRNELEAVFAAMSEGIVVVDNYKRIIRMNRAAGEFFEVKEKDTAGKQAFNVFDNREFLRFLDRALYSAEPIEEQMTLRNGKLFLQIHGSNIKGGNGAQIGALIVLNNVTHIRRMEKIRKDFVANVSHELKTPITLIQGFVDTMLDSPVDDVKDVKRFLRIIANNAQRMNSIIEDLLLLSKIEQDESYDNFPMETINLRDVVGNAIKLVEGKSKEKQIEISLQSSEEVKGQLNVPLFELAVTNLLDNAINYSQPGSAVQVEVAVEAKEIVIKVKDEGCGIEEEHIPRLFERFYRVDKNRSRKGGGTGLGLAIVKHIASLHKGRVAVNSDFGRGSEFRIYLPKSGL